EHVSDAGRTSIDPVTPSDDAVPPPARTPGGFEQRGAVYVASPPQMAYPGGSTVYVVQQKTNGLAIASMVLGIVWVYWIGSILAVVFGHVALSQIKKSGDAQRGRGMAIAGLVLGYVGVAILLLVVVAAIANSGSNSSS